MKLLFEQWDWRVVGAGKGKMDEQLCLEPQTELRENRLLRSIKLVSASGLSVVVDSIKIGSGSSD